MEVFSFPLLAAVVGNLSAQLAKAIIQGIGKKSLSPEVLFASGGMPSSHSSTVSALTIAIGIHEGFGSSLFAMSAVFTGVVAYDAMGVRLAAGRHAAALNVVVEELRILSELARENRPDRGRLVMQRFRERIGHSLEEVFAGLTFGGLIAVAFYHLFYA